jgi:hypothetical protein
LNNKCCRIDLRGILVKLFDSISAVISLSKDIELINLKSLWLKIFIFFEFNLVYHIPDNHIEFLHQIEKTDLYTFHELIYNNKKEQKFILLNY